MYILNHLSAVTIAAAASVGTITTTSRASCPNQSRKRIKHSTTSPQTTLHYNLLILLLFFGKLLISAAQLGGGGPNRNVPTLMNGRLQHSTPIDIEQQPAMLSNRQQSSIQGPGLDLVMFNRRRFELNHNHHYAASPDELRLGELIEHKISTVPEQILANLPDDLNRQVLDSIASDPTLILGETGSGFMNDGSQDPDGASVERLTKSCLTVHASSARPEQLNVTFHLYTKTNPLIPYILRPQVSRLELIKSSPFDPNKPVKWITHGFHTNVDKSEWMVETKDRILAFEDANVILTDWRRGASPALAFYPKAAANAHVVAKMIVRILRRLRGDLDFSKVHLIGHSLGAHIMGFVGSAFTEEHLYQQQQLLMNLDPNQGNQMRDFILRGSPDNKVTNQLIGRITACDPALPCFGPTSSSPDQPPALLRAEQQQQQQQQLQQQQVALNPAEPLLGANEPSSAWTHLRPDSAVVVEVMHSNPGVMGYSDPLGDYDFYPNGFERQPGCGVNQNELAFDGGVGGEVVSRSSGGLLARGRRLLGLSKRQLQSGHLLQSGSNFKSKRQVQAGGSPLDRFIKPIKDFFHGYTCSHHRSVELMVESMYYERVAPDRKLEKNFVCQMVGYRCADYASFKRGFCFRCLAENDCRTFTMIANTRPSADTGYQPSLAAQYFLDAPASTGRSLRSLDNYMGAMPDKFRRRLNASLAAAPQMNGTRFATQMQIKLPKATNSTASSKKTQKLIKRVLPTFNHYKENYLPPKRNQYYFDTRPMKNFCAHHYHLYVKYRRFRVRESVLVDGFKLTGTLDNITQLSPATFNKFTYQSYTMLLVDHSFLGQIDSLLVFGDKINPKQVEYIEVSYMSNIDPRIRAFASAKLYRVAQEPAQLSVNAGGFLTKTSLFVRGSGSMV